MFQSSTWNSSGFSFHIRLKLPPIMQNQEKLIVPFSLSLYILRSPILEPWLSRLPRPSYMVIPLVYLEPSLFSDWIGMDGTIIYKCQSCPFFFPYVRPHDTIFTNLTHPWLFGVLKLIINWFDISVNMFWLHSLLMFKFIVPQMSYQIAPLYLSVPPLFIFFLIFNFSYLTKCTA
jgi:hypothetical protein